jgi:hypothetical protein
MLGADESVVGLMPQDAIEDAVLPGAGAVRGLFEGTQLPAHRVARDLADETAQQSQQHG